MSSTQLYYFFNDQKSFYFSSNGEQILNGDVVKITMPNNNGSQSVIKIVEDNTPSYYALNSIYISLNMTSGINSTYQLMLQGNRNDFTNNTSNQILLILPIFNSVNDTIEKTQNAITNINDVYINALFNNMRLNETYNFTSGSSAVQQTMDINQFLSSQTVSKYYNVTENNINYRVMKFDKSNLWISSFPSRSLLGSLIRKPSITGSYTNVDVKNNRTPLTTITETDIYIDCSPTNNIGEKVDIYTSKDLDQLKFFKIDDIRVWAFRFITICLIILIIFVIIKIFQVSSDSKNPSVDKAINDSNP
jgi:hypothetical protein